MYLAIVNEPVSALLEPSFIYPPCLILRYLQQMLICKKMNLICILRCLNVLMLQPRKTILFEDTPLALPDRKFRWSYHPCCWSDDEHQDIEKPLNFADLTIKHWHFGYRNCKNKL